uniref:C-type lectin domain-containing protein n=1 Tax=Cyprinus carpio carpio TaxID=630221 RepID=A0A8C1F296_CYPCA
MTLTGLLLFVLGLTTGENYRIHIYVSTPMTGNRAFTYCKQYYTDLSTITSQEEHQLLVATAGGTFSEAWIGLYRAVKKTDTWIWSDGQSYNFTKLNVNNSEDLDCVYATELEWYNGFCPDKRPFFCYFNYTLNLHANVLSPFCCEVFTDFYKVNVRISFIQLVIFQDEHLLD